MSFREIKDLFDYLILQGKKKNRNSAIKTNNLVMKEMHTVQHTLEVVLLS